jgi:CHAD domain-containing protein
VSKPASAKVKVGLGYDQRSDAAAATVLRALLEAIGENLDGAVAAEDPEFLHQLRIAVRRSRTVQRQLRGVFAPVDLPGLRAEFKWLQRATGEARDLDVYLEGFEAMRAFLPEEFRDDLDPLRQVLGHWRLAANGTAARALMSRRAVELLADWELLLESLVECPLEDRPAATRPIGQLAGKRIRKVYKHLVAMGKAIDQSSPGSDYHELRKKGKELRYLLDLFGARLFDETVVDDLVSALKALQDVLGRHQDREVQIELLRSLADEVATLPRGPRAVLAMGILVDRLQADERVAREEFATHFAAFSAKRRRRLVKATFR